MKALLPLCALLVSFSVSAAERVALVIGNNRYDSLNKPLTSPVHDATDVAAELRALGYTLITGEALTDAGKDAIITATEQFASAARNAEAAVFYYSGHGVQLGEDNYLLPSDTPRLTGVSVLKNRAVLLRDSVMVALEEAQAQTKVIILDCCRDNPFATQLEAALAQIGKSVRTKSVGEITGYGPGFFLAFATSPGAQAEDGNGQRNSPFTRHMLSRLKTTSLRKDIRLFFGGVKDAVIAEQGSAASPWTNDSLGETEFVLARLTTAEVTPPPMAQAGTADLEKLQREIAELKRRQQQLDAAPPPRDAPLDLPATGYFERAELFAPGPYADYNTYSQTSILKQVQEQLKKRGHYTGSADGARGPGTQSGIITYQQANSLPVSGRLDPATLSSLGLTGIQPLTAPKPVSKPAPKPAAPSTPRAPNDLDSQLNNAINKFLN